MLITVFGVVVLTVMLAMYALEACHPGFVAGFAAGCLASSAYGFLLGTWPFGVVEVTWFGVALRRYTRQRRARSRPLLPGA